MEPIPLVVQQEIALEGLDGITLDSKKTDEFHFKTNNLNFKNFSFVVSLIRAIEIAASVQGKV